MGGRLDATNIVDPLLSIVTDISLDHTEWLGPTVADIAREKAGILRRGGTLITLPQHPEANRVLGEAAVAMEVRGTNAADYMPQAHGGAMDAEGATDYQVNIMGEAVKLAPALDGTHQRRNAALAAAAAVELCNSHGYNIGPQRIAEGIHTARWPGRLEMFPRNERRCDVLLDVAHNPAGAWALRAALSRQGDARRKALLFGCLRDKAVSEMAQILFPVFDRVVVTPVDSPRSASEQDLLEVARTLGVEAQAVASPVAGLHLALRQAAPEDLVVCAGSIYLAGPVRDALLSGLERTT